MPAPKRPNYFQSQFLIVRDFQDEQTYHAEMRQLHNLTMHDWGVVRDGLQVTRSGNDYVISRGSAIDSLGQEIVLDDPPDGKLNQVSQAAVVAAQTDAGAGQDVLITITFREVNSKDTEDLYPPPGGSENVTRKVQSPVIAVTKAPAPAGAVILASVKANGSVDYSLRRLASGFVRVGDSNDLSIDPGRRLGIGTNSPQSPLHVKGNAAILNLEGDDQGFVQFYPKGFAAGRKGWLGFGDASGTHLRINHEAAGSVILTSMQGYVGAVCSGGDGQGIQFGNREIKFRGDGTQHFSIFANKVPNALTFTKSGSNVAMDTADSHIMTLADSGNVGIGTTGVPAARLHLGSGSLQIGASPNSFTIIDSKIAHTFGEETTPRYTLDRDLLGNGQAGIGFNTRKVPSATIAANGSAVGIPTDRTLAFSTSDGTSLVERMRIDSAGKVGVGTTAPVTRLHLGNEITDDSSRVYDPNALMVVHQTPTGTSVLNDPQPVLYLGRQGKSAQAHGAMATFSLSRYENAGPSNVGSRTRLDISLTHDSFSDAGVMTLLSNGNVGIGTNNPADATLQIAQPDSATARRDLLELQHLSNNTFLLSAFGRTHAKSPSTVQLGAWNAEQNISIVTDSVDNLKAGGSTKGIFIQSGGNVGIGTNNPQDKLTINGGALSFQNPNNPVPYCGLDYDPQNDNFRFLVNIGTNVLNTTSMVIARETGWVGIGTTIPKAPLDMGNLAPGIRTVMARLWEGNDKGTGTCLAVNAIATQSGADPNAPIVSFAIEHYFYGIKNGYINFCRGGSSNDGYVRIGPNTNLSGKDVAELFSAAEKIEPGDVVVFDEQAETVKRCASEADGSVIGIVSHAPAAVLGDHDGNSSPIALCGRVPCNVDADIAPIRIGDLLTTSPTRGHAQKVQDASRAAGSIIGKALGSLSKGKGQITVLVALA